MSKFFSVALFGLLICGTAQAAHAAGGRRFYYRSIPSDSAVIRQPAAQANRQSYRRYSVAPSGATVRSSTRSAPAQMRRSAYGPNYWRADRKILGY